MTKAAASSSPKPKAKPALPPHVAAHTIQRVDQNAMRGSKKANIAAGYWGRRNLK